MIKEDCAEQIKQAHEETAEVRKECAEQIQHVKEDIESRKEELSKMSEKELVETDKMFY